MEMAVFGSAATGIGHYCFAKDAYDAWALQCEEEDVLPFQAFEVDRPPQQKNLSPTRSQKESLKRITRIYAHAHVPGEYESTGGENWLHCRPYKPLRTLINAPQFTTWMKYYCQVSLFQTGTKCNRPQCAAIMDICEDHLLDCEMGPIESVDTMRKFVFCRPTSRRQRGIQYSNCGRLGGARNVQTSAH